MSSNPTHWDPDTVTEAGWDDHNDCRPCCNDPNVDSIPQCSTSSDSSQTEPVQHCPLSRTATTCIEGRGPIIFNR